MPTPIRSLESIRSKWTRVTPDRTEDYEEGVRTTPKDWASATAAGKDNYHTAVAATQTADRFAANVQKAGTPTWRNNTLIKGPGRWIEGVGLSGDKYSRNFAPYREAIAGLDLPPRFPTGDARNYERVRAVGQALHRVRTGAETTTAGGATQLR